MVHAPLNQCSAEFLRCRLSLSFCRLLVLLRSFLISASACIIVVPFLPPFDCLNAGLDVGWVDIAAPLISGYNGERDGHANWCFWESFIGMGVSGL